VDDKRFELVRVRIVGWGFEPPAMGERTMTEIPASSGASFGGFSVQRRLPAAPARVFAAFTEPAKLVTVTLHLADDGSTDLDYEFVSTPPPSDVGASRRGVGDMLDRIETGIERGVI
jgi:hypothetical protein